MWTSKEGIYSSASLALLLNEAKCDVYINNRNIFCLLFQGNSFQSFDLKLVWVDENCRKKSAPGL